MFHNREEAGERLGRLIEGERRIDLVLALGGGGIPAARSVARHVDAPLDLFPSHHVIAGDPPRIVGGVAPGMRVLGRERIAAAGLTLADADRLADREEERLVRRLRRLRGLGTPLVRDRAVLLVDDDLVTGLACLAAVRAIRERRPGRLLVAALLASEPAIALLRQEVDELIVLERVRDPSEIGEHYADVDEIVDADLLGG